MHVVWQGSVVIRTSINSITMILQPGITIWHYYQALRFLVLEKNLLVGLVAVESVTLDGPFVMNTKAGILQSFEDFKQNKF